ncbi:hypothetical protein JTE90_009205 [Oedothorax gibbosus]|uniref:Uncharacterized protein n=1 Tax=Oedothorax gibbosus TaxID=931172 RepID=A0AAV6UYW3_9ARAC|nr:hypothetical protein JTE90_009205 [Oedothorax gibbosus]
MTALKIVELLGLLYNALPTRLLYCGLSQFRSYAAMYSNLCLPFRKIAANPLFPTTDLLLPLRHSQNKQKKMQGIRNPEKAGVLFTHSGSVPVFPFFRDLSRRESGSHQTRGWCNDLAKQERGLSGEMSKKRTYFAFVNQLLSLGYRCTPTLKLC